MLSSKSFYDLCQNYMQPQQTVWVAYSGGIDSHVLLHLARQTFINLKAIHVNHNLSPNAATWQQHCVQQCADLAIDLQCVSVDATPRHKQSPEDAARDARRNAWRDILTENDILLTAHHANDQAETILYRLFRGTGPTGLAGMHQHTKIGSARLLRPLLEFSKAEIVAYAATHNLQYITDESNANSKYDRNFIRNEIMPLLNKRWPAVQNNINRTGKLCSQLLACLHPELAQKLAQVVDPPNSININRLMSLYGLWQTEVLRAWMQSHQITPSLQHLQTVINEVIGAAIDANPQFLIGGKLIRRFQGRLYVIDSYAANEERQLQQQFELEWDLQQPITLPDGTTLTPEQISGDKAYLQRLQRHTIIVKKGSHGSKAKKIFQLFGVPVWERGKYPLLFADGKLVAIVGLWAH